MLDNDPDEELCQSCAILT